MLICNRLVVKTDDDYFVDLYQVFRYILWCVHMHWTLRSFYQFVRIFLRSNAKKSSLKVSTVLAGDESLLQHAANKQTQVPSMPSLYKVSGQLRRVVFVRRDRNSQNIICQFWKTKSGYKLCYRKPFSYAPLCMLELIKFWSGTQSLETSGTQ